MNEFVKLKSNNEEYILVNEFLLNGEKIYHFYTFGKDLFCVRENGIYNVIKDKFKIALIKNKFGLIDRKRYPQENEEKNSEEIGQITGYKTLSEILTRRFDRIDRKVVKGIIDEQVECFSDMQDKLGISINISVLKRLLSRISFYSEENLKETGLNGYYTSQLNRIVYDDSVVEDDTIDSKTIRLHEVIHALGGLNINLFYRRSFRGLLEGETENLASDYYDNGTASGIIGNNVGYNFPKDTAYKELVCIVKQMEYMLGKKSYTSIINCNRKFEKDYTKKYGTDLMKYISAQTSRLLNMILDKNTPFEQRIETLKDLQDKMMEVVFDKEIQEVDRIENAISYMDRLRMLEAYRARTYSKDDKGKKVSDQEFRKYYEKKYSQVITLLQEKGYSEQEIENKMKEYKYREVLFKPTNTKEQIKRNNTNIITQIILEKSLETGEMENFDDYEFYQTNELNSADRYSMSRVMILKKGSNQCIYPPGKTKEEEIKQLILEGFEIERIVDFDKELANKIIPVLCRQRIEQYQDIKMTTRPEGMSEQDYEKYMLKIDNARKFIEKHKQSEKEDESKQEETQLAIKKESILDNIRILIKNRINAVGVVINQYVVSLRTLALYPIPHKKIAKEAVKENTDGKKEDEKVTWDLESYGTSQKVVNKKLQKAARETNTKPDSAKEVEGIEIDIDG